MISDPPKIDLVINAETGEWTVANFEELHMWALQNLVWYRQNVMFCQQPSTQEVDGKPVKLQPASVETMKVVQLFSCLTNLTKMLNGLIKHAKRTGQTIPL